MKLIGLLLLFGALGYLLLGVFLGRVIRFFNPSSTRTNQHQSKNRSKPTPKDTAPKKFSKNEGEYISYEEVKDEE